MDTLKTIGATLSLCLAMGAPAYSQNSASLSSREVVGDWTLRITPAERRGFSITVESDDGGPPDLDLTVTARTASALTCAVGGDPAECAIDGGDLVVTSAKDGARMTFTLRQRTRTGFAGTARIKARLLPFGTVHVGSVTMSRR